MVTKISLIAAMDKNRPIGKAGNELPWHLSADLKRFKSITLGKPIIMGRKTFESIGEPLPERTNIIITRNEEYGAPGCVVVPSPKEALKSAGNAPEVVVIGGAEIFAQFLPLAQRMYLTQVDGKFEGNVYFPEWNPEEWHEIFREAHGPDEKNAYRYTFLILERRDGSA